MDLAVVAEYICVQNCSHLHTVLSLANQVRSLNWNVSARPLRTHSHEMTQSMEGFPTPDQKQPVSIVAIVLCEPTCFIGAILMKV